jgi:hypothetical protein
MRALRLLSVALLTAVASLPSLLSADGGDLVPCVGPDCGWCELLRLANNLINYAIVLATLVATLLFVYAGILYATSPGNTGNIQKAHRIFIDVLIGFIIILAAYLIVGVIMSTLLAPERVQLAGGVWREVLCDVEAYTPPILATDTSDAAPEVVGSDDTDTVPEGCDGGLTSGVPSTVRNGTPGAWCTSVLACRSSGIGGGLTETTLCFADEATCNTAAALNRGFSDAPSCSQNAGTLPPPPPSGPGEPSVPYNHSAALSSIRGCATGVSGCVIVTSTAGPTGVQDECTTGSGCTTLNGIQSSAIGYANRVAEETGGTVEITGGTEPGHSSTALPIVGGGTQYTHGNGYKIDIDDRNDAVNTYFEEQRAANGGTNPYTYTDPAGNQVAVYYHDSHWDVTVVPQ